ncbi:MAG: hypothetical protein IT285_02630 [Bdellovibrionales bacterium]|nr:hypothetical protein [Bdellovibrionales bacterium]
MTISSGTPGRDNVPGFPLFRGLILGWALIAAPEAWTSGAAEPAAVEAPAEEAKAPPPPEPVSPEQAKSLLAEFQRAQASARAALGHRQKLELSELASAQQARRQEWEQQARLEKQAFFDREKAPDARKLHVDQMQAKRQALLKTLEDERVNREKEFQAQTQAFKETQARDAQEFQKHLKAGHQPPFELWPGRGR